MCGGVLACGAAWDAVLRGPRGQTHSKQAGSPPAALTPPLSIALTGRAILTGRPSILIKIGVLRLFECLYVPGKRIHLALFFIGLRVFCHLRITARLPVLCLSEAAADAGCFGSSSPGPIITRTCLW